MSETETTGPTLQERMAAIARGERLEMPTVAPQPALTGEVLPPIVEAEPISAALVETARAEGADVETGELPPREEPVRAPPPAAETANVSKEIEAEQVLQPAAPSPPHPQIAGRQEVIEPERAADGQPVPFAARDAGAFVNLLENGQFSADVVAALTALTTGMSELAENTGKRQKGSITLKITLQTDDNGEAFFVTPEVKVVAPKVPRRQTMMWQDEKGHMSPSQPRQRVFFGQPQEVGGARQIRDASEPRRQF